MTINVHYIAFQPTNKPTKPNQPKQMYTAPKP